jgi:hypothetical protein
MIVKASLEKVEGSYVSEIKNTGKLVINEGGEDDHPIDDPESKPEVDNKGLISGKVYIDLNQNGQYDIGEAFIANVEVKLSGSAEDTVYSNASGYYEFAVEDGTYTLTVPEVFNGMSLVDQQSQGVFADIQISLGDDQKYYLEIGYKMDGEKVLELGVSDTVILQHIADNPTIYETFTKVNLHSGAAQQQDYVEYSNTMTLNIVNTLTDEAVSAEDVIVTFTPIAGFENKVKPIAVQLDDSLDIQAVDSGIVLVKVALKDEPHKYGSLILVVPGDVNRDGVIDGRDTTAVNKYVNSYIPANTTDFRIMDEYTFLLANINRDYDKNGNPRIDGRDTTALNKFVNSYIPLNTSGWR